MAGREEERHAGAAASSAREQQSPRPDLASMAGLEEERHAGAAASSAREQQSPRPEVASMEGLERFVKTFPSRLPDNSVSADASLSEKYCGAWLWITSGLMTEVRETELVKWLQKDEASKQMLGDMVALKQFGAPWITAMHAREREKQILDALRTETLGRFIFAILLSFIRGKTAANPAHAEDELRGLSEAIEGWDTVGAEQRLEQQLLLKELRVGRREVQLPTWSGKVSTKVETRASDYLFDLTRIADQLGKGDVHDVLSEVYNCAQSAPGPVAKELLQLHHCLGRHLPVIKDPPMNVFQTLLQLASQEPAASRVRRAAEAALHTAPELQNLIEWTNKYPLPCVMRLHGHRWDACCERITRACCKLAVLLRGHSPCLDYAR